MANNIVWSGTELKLNINIEPIDGKHMSEYNWKAIIYCTPRNSIEINKEDAIKVDDDNYIILINTTNIGVGNLMVKLIAYIDDNHFNKTDGKRTEISIMSTGINIVRG